MGRLLSESVCGVCLYFQLISNTHGNLDSSLVAYISTLLENAVIVCEGSETHRLMFRLASKCMLCNNVYK